MKKLRPKEAKKQLAKIVRNSRSEVGMKRKIFASVVHVSIHLIVMVEHGKAPNDWEQLRKVVMNLPAPPKKKVQAFGLMSVFCRKRPCRDAHRHFHIQRRQSTRWC